MSDTANPDADGYGCRSTATAFAFLTAFVVIAGVVGVSMALGPGCIGACETTGFALYGAALPISALFAITAGDLPIAWPLDVTFWLVNAFASSRLSERTGRSLATVVGATILIALGFGATISMFIATASIS
jgi:hypothetical protein